MAYMALTVSSRAENNHLLVLHVYVFVLLERFPLEP